MNNPVVRDAVLSRGMWVLPVLLFIAYGSFLREDIAPDEPDREPGYRWLALPAGIHGRDPRFAGWHGLDGATPPDAPPGNRDVIHEPETTALDEDPPPVQPFRIRLAGRIRDESEDLYCFFDTNEGRWFRLSEGAADLRAGVRLEVDPVNGRPVITNLSDGNRYVAKAGETRLEKIDLGEPSGAGNFK